MKPDDILESLAGMQQDSTLTLAGVIKLAVDASDCAAAELLLRDDIGEMDTARLEALLFHNLLKQVRVALDEAKAETPEYDNLTPMDCLEVALGDPQVRTLIDAMWWRLLFSSMARAVRLDAKGGGDA